MVDTSNHKRLKVVPVLIQSVIPRKGVQIKVIKFHNLKGETTDVLTTYKGCIQIPPTSTACRWVQDTLRKISPSCLRRLIVEIQADEIPLTL
jgi:hypothetical protein